MKQKSHRDTSDSLCAGYDKPAAANYQWKTGKKARLQALSLFLIRSIVEQHGGTIDIDLGTDTININVPEKERAACAQEIEEQVGAMCC